MKFSIILPVRNGGEYVKECISSILSQTYTDFNVIVLDNASTDGTPEWIGAIGDNRIVLHRSFESLGIGGNWARIRSVPKNQFMTMIGHDDLLQPDYLQEMDRLINENPAASLYQVHFKYIDDKGAFVRDCLPMPEKLSAAQFLSRQMERTIDSTGTGYMMRSEDFDELGGMPVEYPNLIFSDFQLWISLMLRGFMAISPRPCFSYRLHQSLSRITNGMDYQAAFIRYIEFLTTLMHVNASIKEVVQMHGKEFLLYYCEAMSHRILKTPIAQRSIRVSDFIDRCSSLATQFIPGQEFKPLGRFRIRIAKQIDQWAPARNLFQLYKKI